MLPNPLFGQLRNPEEAKVPPSACSVVPVMYADSCDARKTTAPDTSVGSP